MKQFVKQDGLMCVWSGIGLHAGVTVHKRKSAQYTRHDGAARLARFYALGQYFLYLWGMVRTARARPNRGIYLSDILLFHRPFFGTDSGARLAHFLLHISCQKSSNRENFISNHSVMHGGAIFVRGKRMLWNQDEWGIENAEKRVNRGIFWLAAGIL